jgi:hypothetical protein
MIKDIANNNRPRWSFKSLEAILGYHLFTNPV